MYWLGGDLGALCAAQYGVDERLSIKARTYQLACEVWHVVARHIVRRNWWCRRGIIFWSRHQVLYFSGRKATDLLAGNRLEPGFANLVQAISTGAETNCGRRRLRARLCNQKNTFASARLNVLPR